VESIFRIAALLILNVLLLTLAILAQHEENEITVERKKVILVVRELLGSSCRSFLKTD
jgi:HJR/Mrr/RecB family endonuclease